MNRRHFLQLSAAGGSAMAGWAARNDSDPPQKFKIGMAATTWVSGTPSTASYWNAIQSIAALNIGATEADDSNAHLVESYGSNPAEFVKRSYQCGVYLAGVFQSLALHEQEKLPEMQAKIRSVAGFLKGARAEYIALGWSRPTSQDIERTAHVMDELGRLSSEEYGIAIAFHAERDVPKNLILKILDQTNPKYVHLCADVGHLTATGLDAVKVVKDYSSRLAVSHWKDFDPKLSGPDYLGKDAKGDFVELGKGIVDFQSLTRVYREIGYNGWVMLELDRTREPSIAASAREMKAYVTDRLKLQFYPPHT